jgi:hypothetical protein
MSLPVYFALTKQFYAQNIMMQCPYISEEFPDSLDGKSIDVGQSGIGVGLLRVLRFP